VSKIKLLPTDAAQGTALDAISSYGPRAGKTPAKAIEKSGTTPFHDVLGALRRSAGAQTAAVADRSGHARPGLAAPARHADAMEHGETADTGDAHKRDASAPEEQAHPPQTVVSALTLDPLRGVILAANARHPADGDMAGERAGDADDTRRQPSAITAGLGQADKAASRSEVVGHGTRKAGDPAASPDDKRNAGPGSLPADIVAMPSEPLTRNGSPSGTSTAPLNLRPPLTQKVEVVSQQTHFAPVVQLDTLQQVSNAIRNELSAPAERTPATAPTMTNSLAQDVGAPPVRILTIRLDPPELGEVTVRMRLQGDNLELELTATQYATSQMLQQNREVLHDLIRHSGYVPDIASVQQAAPDASGLSRTNQQPSQAQGQHDPSSRASGEQAGGRSGHEQAGAEGSRQERGFSTGRGSHGAGADEAAHDFNRTVYL